MKLKSYSLAGKKLPEVEMKNETGSSINPQLLKDYIVAYRRNQRQWSASTKGRSEVSHSNKKPHKQKGTGRARQGSLASPQFKGGGVVFGPKPKFDQHIRINQKEKRAIIKSLFASKIEDSKLVVVDKLEMKAPKTQEIVRFLEKSELDKRVLFVLPSTEKLSESEKEAQTNFKKSIRNLAKVEFSHANLVNGYQLLKAQYVVMTQEDLKAVLEA